MAIRDLIYFCCILIEISSHDLPSNKELNYAQERQTRIKEFLKLSPTYTVVGSNNRFDYDNINDITLDPDAHKNMTQLIEGEGYLSEQHTVETSDGFLLGLFRIPAGRNESCSGQPSKPKPVVLLQHGMLSSSCDWVMNFAHGSLGFILADAGYDVWMGNNRGNTYSRRHSYLKPDDIKFWDWSYDEMALYDLPAFIDVVLRQTNQSSLTYVGHSQGTTQAFALLSQRPEYQKKINQFVALAPVTLINHIKSPIKYLALFSDDGLFDVFGKKYFLEGTPLVHEFVDLLCPNLATRWVCENIMFLLAGPDLTYLNKTRLPVYMNHSPAGISVRGMVHFAQINQFVALAPVTLINQIKSPIKYLALFSDDGLFDVFGKKYFLEGTPLVHEFVDLLCPNLATRWVCENIMFLLAGPDLTYLNKTRLPVYMNHSPAGISVRGMVHFAQTIRQKKFQMYDFGSEENMKRYNQTSPPQYDVTKVKVPIIAFTGSRDWLADPQDAAALLSSLPLVQHQQEVPGWNHLDLIWAQNAGPACYLPLLKWLVNDH